MLPGSPFGGDAVGSALRLRKLDDRRLRGPALAIVKSNNRPMKKPGRSYSRRRAFLLRRPPAVSGLSSSPGRWGRFFVQVDQEPGTGAKIVFHINGGGWHVSLAKA
jgi:hypothetical protein